MSAFTDQCIISTNGWIVKVFSGNFPAFPGSFLRNWATNSVLAQHVVEKKKDAPKGVPLAILAAAAVVIAAAVIAAAVAAPQAVAVAAAGEQNDQNDDPPAAVAAEKAIVIAHE